MKYLFYLATFLLFLLPFVFSGHLSVFSIFVVLISSLLLFIASRFDIKIYKSKANIALISYFVILLIFLPFSLLFSRSIISLVWSLSFISIFILCQNLVNEESKLKNLSIMIVILTALFGTFSLSNFIEIGLTSYIRLDGIIGPHNVYGGFLIIPFLLSVYLLVKESNKWQKRLWYISSAIILVSLVLTFSRGTWLSIVLAVLISLVLFRQFYTKTILKKIQILWKPVTALLVLTFVLFCGVWYMAKQTTIDRDPNKPINTSLYSGENEDQNAFVARLHYYEDAWNTSLRAPIVGFGFGMYAQALRIYKTDPNFSSFADPHNWALKMLVENGFIATIIFIIFIVTFFLQIIRLIKKRKEVSYLAIFIFTGLIASVIHGLMDFDWSINQLLFIFFIFSGSLYGYLINTRGVNEDVSEKSYLPSWTKYILLILTIIAAIISIQFLRADLVRAKGDVFYMQKDYENALNSYFESVTLNSHEPLTWYNLWRVYYSMNKFGPAKNSIKKSLELFPENGIYWGTLARTEEMLGEKENYRESLIKAIKYFPASDLGYYVKLVEYDFEQKKYDEALAYIDQVLPIYSKYEKSIWYKNDPNWSVMSANLKVLRDFKEKIGDIVLY